MRRTGQKVSELQVDNVCWLPDAGVRMEQQICHDDEKIYVHQVAREKEHPRGADR